MRIHYLDTNPTLFQISSSVETRVPLVANIPTLYALEDHVPAEDLASEGAILLIGKQNLASPMGLECFKHTVYLNTVFNVYPRVSTKAPPTDGSIKAEDYEHTLNSLKNLPIFQRINHVAVLAKAAEGSPALILQPGPSMDMDFIRGMAGRCVTIAIGRTLPRLLEHGFVPDIVYQQDTSLHSWEVSFEVIRGQKLDTILVANPVGHLHEYFGCFSKVYKSWNYFPFEVDRFPQVIKAIAPSTTTGAFTLAMHLGCNPVILHGGDFGAPLPAAPPAPGVAFPGVVEQDGLYIFGPTPHVVHDIAITGPDGTGVMTSSDYLSASQWIKRTALSLKENGSPVDFYDHSATGLLTASSVIAPFREDALAGRTRRLEKREYSVPFHWQDFVGELLRRYRNIRRILASTGRTPEISLINPYNSIYTDMPNFSTKPFELEPDQVVTALARTDTVIAVLEDVLAKA